MALEYNSNTTFERLAPILEEYANWFGQIAVFVAYVDEHKELENIVVPSSFQEWVDSLGEDSDLSPAVIENLTKLHEDMVRVGVSILGLAKDGKKPSYDGYVEFKNLYNAFLLHLRRLEKDQALDGSGLDEATGLRSSKVIKSDLKKEMERLSRQGNPFSLVVARIDQFKELEDKTLALKLSVVNVKRCMRSFDDAYHLGNGCFLLSLKHADIIGAQAAVGRLQNYLKNDEENTADMTMSYCMAEPVSGDEVATLLQNMQQDLSDHLNDQDIVLKFLELSPLERFVNQTK